MLITQGLVLGTVLMSHRPDHATDVLNRTNTKPSAPGGAALRRRLSHVSRGRTGGEDYFILYRLLGSRLGDVGFCGYLRLNKRVSERRNWK
ncbi:Uncharacterized protein TCM_042696 [Theobroma cacao]|uniref:Uncharacterized protein n=1 Tax=Theobroma cacao TaxID=3641 RepID=A0A061FM80_THECC|nr:Uncharacterized protein TCM_042696 [Theobroma cacao]